MIITVAGFKGGVGKTTTAVHLACYFAQKSKNVLLVDGDPNRSATGWGKRGSLPFQTCDLMAAPKASRGKDAIVIDTEARPKLEDLKELSEGCDFMVLPTSPQALSVDATLQTVEALKGIQDYAILITMVDSRKKSTAAAARAAIEGMGLPVLKTEIRLLTAYEKASLLGVPVYESGDRFGRIAWREYQDLGKELESYAS